jgi:UDP-N-acetylmuramoylalanine--D-glutamate ligase
MADGRPLTIAQRYGGKRLHVLGAAGTEGASVIDFLMRSGITAITAHDLHTGEEFAAEFERTHQWLAPEDRRAALERLRSYPITIHTGGAYLHGIADADVIFVPQSWFRHAANDPVRALRDRGTQLSSMTHLFFERAPCPIIGVTGTNGKFTVAYLIHQMLLRSGCRAFFSGNDRSHVPMLYYADALTPRDWLVLEISNRQLVGLPYSPHIGVITNIAPHHLDDHGTMEAYVEVKETLLRHQRPDDLAVLNADNAYTRGMARRAHHPHLFSRTETLRPGAYLDGGRAVIARDRVEQIIPLDVLQGSGGRTIENALAALLAASLAGASAPAMAEALAEFRGLPYRSRLVGEVAGVRYIEDSLATNPAAAAAAVVEMDRPFVLIAGGARPKAQIDDFALLRDALGRSPVRAVLLIGTTAGLLEDALAELPVPVERLGTLDAAFARARSVARSGETVLFSPACESFDQFRDYRERGDHFVALVQAVQ